MGPRDSTQRAARVSRPVAMLRLAHGVLERLAHGLRASLVTKRVRGKGSPFGHHEASLGDCEVSFGDRGYGSAFRAWWPAPGAAVERAGSLKPKCLLARHSTYMRLTLVGVCLSLGLLAAGCSASSGPGKSGFGTVGTGAAGPFGSGTGSAMG